ncbi:MAG: protein-glutamine glutaminase family protein [Crocinitomicaceae bacterium]|nr:protein-glutamine glutaminase family protein [Crocinitomicaceae bacterium]
MKTTLIFLLTFCSLFSFSQKADFNAPLNEVVDLSPICLELAEKLNQTLIDAKCFDWTNRSNNCEDRANAACLLLDAWGISNAKAWCFAGKNANYLNGKGTLKGWSYHVAAFVLVENEGEIDSLVFDPLTSTTLMTIKEWSNEISATSGNLYFTTTNKRYQQNKVAMTTTWKSSDDSFDRTLKGLTRYNDYSSRRKRKTRHFLDARIISVTQAFFELLYIHPKYLSENNCIE